MQDPSFRMLRLLSLLQTHRFWPGAELADRLQVSSRTLRRDIDRLREFGYIVDATRGTDGGYRLEAGADLPPLLLDDDEAVAITVGMRNASNGGVSGIEETAVRVLAKLEQVLPDRLRRQVNALQSYTVPLLYDGGPRVESDVLLCLTQACRDWQRVRFAYTRRDDEESTRYVEPYRLVSIGRRWYLVAWDMDRRDWRSFRVDRITSLEVTTSRFAPRQIPGDDAAAFVQSSMQSAPRTFEVSVLIHASKGVVERGLPLRGGTLTEIDGGTLLEINTDSLEWTAAALGVVGADFTVNGPQALKEHCATLSERMKAAAN